MITAVLTLFCCLGLPCLTLGQVDQQPSRASRPSKVQTAGMFRNGIAITVVLHDTTVASLGIPLAEVKHTAGKGARAAGWSLNEQSPSVVVVTLTSVQQRHEDLDAIRIRVEAGLGGSVQGPVENTGGGIVAENIVEVPRSDHTLILSTTERMVRGAASKLRKIILKDLLQSPDRALERTNDRNEFK